MDGGTPSTPRGATGLAARRLDRQRLRAAKAAPSTGRQVDAERMAAEILRLRMEREQREQRLLEQLQALASAATLEDISTEDMSPQRRQNHIEVAAAPTTLLAECESMAKQAMPHLGTLHLSELETRDWLRGYLTREGRAAQLLALLEGAPPGQRQALVALLERLLCGDTSVNAAAITMLGATAMVEQSRQ